VKPLTHDFSGDPVYDRRQAELIEAARRLARERILNEQRSRPRSAEELLAYNAEQQVVQRLLDDDGFATRATDEEWNQYTSQRIELAKQRILEGGTLNRLLATISEPAARRTWPSHPKRIVITPIAAKTISDEIARHSDVETGGCLRGRFTDGGVIVAAATIYQDEMTVRGPRSLTHNLLEVSETPDCVGTWHSHLHIEDASLSTGDVTATANDLADLDQAQQVSLVVSAEGTIDLHRRRFTWNAYLFSRDRDGVTFETLAGT
jgi:hypothetical protein